MLIDPPPSAAGAARALLAGAGASWSELEPPDLTLIDAKGKVRLGGAACPRLTLTYGFENTVGSDVNCVLGAFRTTLDPGAALPRSDIRACNISYPPPALGRTPAASAS